MLDDHRGKAVAAIGDFGHRASLPSASLPSYPVTLTKPAYVILVSCFRDYAGRKKISEYVNQLTHNEKNPV